MFPRGRADFAGAKELRVAVERWGTTRRCLLATRPPAIPVFNFHELLIDLCAGVTSHAGPSCIRSAVRSVFVVRRSHRRASLHGRESAVTAR